MPTLHLASALTDHLLRQALLWAPELPAITDGTLQLILDFERVCPQTAAACKVRVSLLQRHLAAATGACLIARCPRTARLHERGLAGPPS